MFRDKKIKKEHSGEENYQENLWQESYMDGQRYDEEYWMRFERNWRCQKKEPIRGQRIIETIKKEEKEIGQEESGLKEQNKENDKMRNICDLYYKL